MREPFETVPGLTHSTTRIIQLIMPTSGTKDSAKNQFQVAFCNWSKKYYNWKAVLLKNV